MRAGRCFLRAARRRSVVHRLSALRLPAGLRAARLDFVCSRQYGGAHDSGGPENTAPDSGTYDSGEPDAPAGDASGTDAGL
jgi:hypothetical protein